MDILFGTLWTHLNLICISNQVCKNWSNLIQILDMRTGVSESSLLKPGGETIHVKWGRPCCFCSALGCSIGLFSNSEIYWKILFATWDLGLLDLRKREGVGNRIKMSFHWGVLHFSLAITSKTSFTNESPSACSENTETQKVSTDIMCAGEESTSQGSLSWAN